MDYGKEAKELNGLMSKQLSLSIQKLLISLLNSRMRIALTWYNLIALLQSLMISTSK